mmetsp:Transcript_7204/g.44779  ORF Transcript_7204/g.44779 Transcript_7204/m.44779 type:complete len:127 (-) Transcript_7204:4268-4648(-)
MRFSGSRHARRAFDVGCTRGRKRAVFAIPFGTVVQLCRMAFLPNREERQARKYAWTIGVERTVVVLALHTRKSRRSLATSRTNSAVSHERSCGGIPNQVVRCLGMCVPKVVLVPPLPHVNRPTQKQ